MSDPVLTPILPESSLAVPTRKPDTPAKIHDAAQQFEALLIGQILQSVSEDGGWLGSGGDSASSCATGFAQEQLASMMARNGGFGLADIIAKGLACGQQTGS
jgi:Rod binding domain-containing protein